LRALGSVPAVWLLLILRAASVPEVELLRDSQAAVQEQPVAVLRVLESVPAVGLQPLLQAVLLPEVELLQGPQAAM